MGTAMSLSSPRQQTFLHTSSVPGPGDTKCESDQLCPGSGIRLHTRLMGLEAERRRLPDPAWLPRRKENGGGGGVGHIP